MILWLLATIYRAFIYRYSELKCLSVSTSRDSCGTQGRNTRQWGTFLFWGSFACCIYSIHVLFTASNTNRINKS